ncbi:MAG: hypothetical protein MUO78_02785 [candidate division Zixibacteria bacterium]|nr:hypothetical protein [candidate division Zixibacteria bacterium]
MKKRLILGLLIGVLLLFFTISSWALDYESYLKAKHDGHPEQDMERVPIIPQTITNYPSTIKFILIPNIQNLLILIPIDKISTQTPSKVNSSVKNLTNGVKEQDE